MVSLLGIAVLLGIAFALSSAKRSISFRTVGGAFAMQALIGRSEEHTSELQSPD